MQLIPWRFKAFFSNHTPLLYHLVANFGLKGNSAEHWNDRLAETWDDAGRSWPLKTDIIRGLTQPMSKILDVACGTGGILRTLQASGYENLFATEISTYAVERLRDQGIHAVVGKLPKIPFPDASFDVVIASQILEHVIRRATFVREISRVLVSGGEALIFVPDSCLGPIDEPEHVIIYNSHSLRRFLTAHFQVVSIETIRDKHQAAPVLFARVRKTTDS